MKFTNAAILLSCGSVLANDFGGAFGAMETHQLVRRATSIEVIQTALYNISNSTTALTETIAGFSLSQVTSLQTATAGGLQTIMTAIRAITPLEPITTEDALTLAPIIQGLSRTTNRSISTTISKKAAFGGLAPVVRANLQQQLNASTSLSLTISQKLPQALIATSATLSAPIQQSIRMGIEEFATPVTNTPENSPELFGIRSAALPTAVTSHIAIVSAMLVATIITMA